MSGLPWKYHDGGRAEAGRKGDAGDCVTRAIAIATGVPYGEVYDGLHERALGDRAYMARLQLRYGANARRHASPRDGVERRIYEPYLLEEGFVWRPTMKIGSGCTVHMAPGELPDDDLVVSLSKHLSAVRGGVVYDTHDPCRDGTRCVYGYYRPR